MPPIDPHTQFWLGCCIASFVAGTINLPLMFFVVDVAKGQFKLKAK